MERGAGARQGECLLALFFSERNYSGDLRRTHGLGRHQGFSTRKRREFLPHFGFEIPIASNTGRSTPQGKASCGKGSPSRNASPLLLHDFHYENTTFVVPLMSRLSSLSLASRKRRIIRKKDLPPTLSANKKRTTRRQIEIVAIGATCGEHLERQGAWHLPRADERGPQFQRHPERKKAARIREERTRSAGIVVAQPGRPGLATQRSSTVASVSQYRNHASALSPRRC